jgi:4-diphosphocytidyl-2-C-methyl-D-erythritol kinase
VLRGLDALFPGAVPAAELRRLALSLGADVPFFLQPRPALVSGVGERCEPLAEPWPAFDLLLVNPGRPLSTRAVFAAYAERAAGPGRRHAALLELVRKAAGDPTALGALLTNDLEPAALRLCPALGGLREGLRAAGARAVGLSGSGATLFGVFPAAEAARAAARRFPAPLWTWVARSAESR